jgi:DNA-binding transcriptional LysR family regulator
VQPVIAQEWLTPALPRFNALYPDIQLDIRYFMLPVEAQTQGVDVMLVMGWHQPKDLVRRQLGATASSCGAHRRIGRAWDAEASRASWSEHNCCASARDRLE